MSAPTLACGEFELRRQTETVTKDAIAWNVFSSRVKNALLRASIESWEQLQQLETDDLLAIPGIGAVAAQEISEVGDPRRSKRPARTRKRANGEAP